VLKKCFITIKI